MDFLSEMGKLLTSGPRSFGLVGGVLAYGTCVNAIWTDIATGGNSISPVTPLDGPIDIGTGVLIAGAALIYLAGATAAAPP